MVSETFVVYDSAGIRIVENSAPARKGYQFWSLDPEPLLVIGDGPAVAGEQFEHLVDARRLEDGRIVVSDAGALEIRFFSADGQFLYSVGGKGKGPGEFTTLGRITIVGPDSLFVFDGQLRRISVFDLDAELVASLTLENTGDPVRPLALYDLAGVYDDGTFLLVPISVPADAVQPRETYWDSVPNLRYSRAGTLLDTIGVFSGQLVASAPEFTTAPPFARASYHAFTDGYFYIGRAERFEIHVYDPQGQVSIVRKAHGIEPVSDRDIERWIEFRIRHLEGSQREKARVAGRKYVSELQVPRSKPAHADIVVDSERNLWVRHFAAPWHTGSVPWSVFDPSGRWLGDVQLPKQLSPTDIRDGVVVGIWRSEWGVESVRLYHLTKRAIGDGHEVSSKG